MRGSALTPNTTENEAAMNPSIGCLVAASAMGMPAWVIDVKSLPHEVQILWLVALLGTALLAGVFWARDGR